MADKKEKIQKRLTIAELRNCKGFENFTDERAEETIKTLEKLSILFYEFYMKQKQTKEKLSLNKKEEKHEGKNCSKERDAA